MPAMEHESGINHETRLLIVQDRDLPSRKVIQIVNGIPTAIAVIKILRITHGDVKMEKFDDSIDK